MTTEAKQRFLTVGFMGEADIDTQATPETTFENLCNIAEQCGYFVSKGVWDDYYKTIICQTEGTYFIKYHHDEFIGVYIMKRIQ